MHTRSMAWTARETTGVLFLTAVGAALRFTRLTAPGQRIGDENFYVKDACWYLFSLAAQCETPREGNLEHPPLGKWLIAWGIRFWDFDLFGFRIVPAILGAFTIPLLYMLARRLLRSRTGAFVAAGALAVDFMHIVHSRAAMLDVFLVFFVVLAFLFVAHENQEGRGPPGWRYAAGAAAGAAVATKWSGIMALFAIALIGITRDIRRHDAVERRAALHALRAEGPKWLLAFVVLPALVYTLSFIGRVQGELLALPWHETSWLNALWDRQILAFDYHAHDIWTHRFASPPWSWPVTRRGIPLFMEPGDSIRSVISTGNPIVWVLAIAATLFVTVRWIRNLGSNHGGENLIAVGFMWTYLPWLVYSAAPYLFFTHGARAMFIWYLMPALPFMYLALGYAAASMSRALPGRIAIGLVSIVAVAALAVYYPLLTAVPVSEDAFEKRTALFDDCDPPRDDAFVYIEPVASRGMTSFKVNTLPAESYLSPTGWCWL